MKKNEAILSMRCVVLLAILLIVPLIASAGEVGYSAMVMDVKGKVLVRHGGAKKTVDLGCLLYPGDSLETTKGASLTVAYLESGLEEQWSGAAKFVVEKNGSKPAAARINRKSRVTVPQIASAQKGSMKLRGFKQLKMEVGGLSNTRTVEERPTFLWSPAQAVEKYRVRFYSLSEDEPVWQRTTQSAELPFPSAEPPLNPGTRYEWVIESLKDGYVVAQKRSCFSLPPDNELVEIKKAISEYQAQLMANSADTAVRLRFILFLEGHQLYDDALAQYAILQKQYGESKSLAERRKILTDLRSLNCPTY